MSAFYAGLAEIFEVPQGEIGPAFDLASHTWDSLAIVSTLALIDECFNQMVDGKALGACETVADIEALVGINAAKVA
jgi:acyl carrier protein